MPLNNKNTTIPFTPCHIDIPLTLADDVLINDSMGGTLTLPVRDGKETIITTIPFYLTDNFSFNLSNNWEELVNMDAVKTINNIANLLGTFDNNTHVTVQSRKMMAATWTGSEIPEFNINTIFVCTQRKYNPVKIIRALAATCLPEELENTANPPDTLVNMRDGIADGVTGLGKGVNNFFNNDKSENFAKTMSEIGGIIKSAGMSAPLGYGLNLEDISPIEGTTLAIRIGNWFKASDLIVKNISNIEFSKEVIAPINDQNGNYSNDSYIGNCRRILGGETEYGFPVYAKCSITLRPVTLITPKEFNDYFITIKSTQNEFERLNSDLNLRNIENRGS